ncbi:MAG TPA: type II toxin-antitoxin system RelE/ParE family toxin [Planctomycetota bacterium]|nr:type II toxin-antitoxin system RelE/ParE family toxin [Planctomycetota bacterium]
MNVELTPEAVEQLHDLPFVIVARVRKIVRRLQEWPRVSGAKPLRGPLAGHYRIRTGDYRVQFRIEHAAVVVEKVGHRDRFYEE